MALEDAVTLSEAVRVARGDFARTPDQRSSGFKAGAPSAAWTRVRNSCIDCVRKESEAA